MILHLVYKFSSIFTQRTYDFRRIANVWTIVSFLKEPKYFCYTILFLTFRECSLETNEVRPFRQKFKAFFSSYSTLQLVFIFNAWLTSKTGLAAFAFKRYCCIIHAVHPKSRNDEEAYVKIKFYPHSALLG